MGVGATAPAGFGVQADGPGSLHPLGGRQRETVEARLGFKPLEFDRFEVRVVDLLPNPQKLNGVAIAQPPVENGLVAEAFDHVGERDVILVVPRGVANRGALDCNAAVFHEERLPKSGFDARILA